MVLQGDTWTRRRELMVHFVKISEKCGHLGNFAGLSAITEGIDSEFLKPLHLTWGVVDKSRRLECLKGFVDPLDSFKTSRKAHELCGQDRPCVPFLRMYLRSIADVDESHDVCVSTNNSHVNFKKCQILFDLCNDALQFQHRKYDPELVENPELLQYLEEQLGMVDAYNDKWFWDKAKEVKVCEDQVSDVKRTLASAGF